MDLEITIDNRSLCNPEPPDKSLWYNCYNTQPRRPSYRREVSEPRELRYREEEQLDYDERSGRYVARETQSAHPQEHDNLLHSNLQEHMITPQEEDAYDAEELRHRGYQIGQLLETMGTLEPIDILASDYRSPHLSPDSRSPRRHEYRERRSPDRNLSQYQSSRPRDNISFPSYYSERVAEDCERRKGRKRSRDEMREDNSHHASRSRSCKERERSRSTKSVEERTGKMHSKFSDASDEDEKPSPSLSVSRYRQDLESRRVKKRSRIEHKPRDDTHKSLNNNHSKEDLETYLKSRLPRSRRTKSDSSHTFDHNPSHSKRRMHISASSLKCDKPQKEHIYYRREFIDGPSETPAPNHSNALPDDIGTEGYFAKIVDKYLDASSLQDMISSLASGQTAVDETFGAIKARQERRDDTEYDWVHPSRVKAGDSSKRGPYQDKKRSESRRPKTRGKTDSRPHSAGPFSSTQSFSKIYAQNQDPERYIRNPDQYKEPNSHGLVPSEVPTFSELQSYERPLNKGLPKSVTELIPGLFEPDRLPSDSESPSKSSPVKGKSIKYSTKPVSTGSNHDQRPTVYRNKLTRKGQDNTAEDLELLKSTKRLFPLPKKVDINKKNYCSYCMVECKHLRQHKDSLLHKLVTHEWWDTHDPPPKSVGNTFYIWCFICHARLEMLSYGNLIDHFVSTRHQLNKRRWLELYGPPLLHEWCVWAEIKKVQKSEADFIGNIHYPSDVPTWAKGERVIPVKSSSRHR